jgi:hypothetical protein
MLPGLTETGVFLRYATSYEYGVVDETDVSPTTVVTSRIRLTTLDPVKDEIHVEGVDAEKLWKVFLPYHPEIKRHDVLQVVRGTSTTIYRIVWLQHQKNDLGVWHHTSLIVEVQEETVSSCSFTVEGISVVDVYHTDVTFSADLASPESFSIQGWAVQSESPWQSATGFAQTASARIIRLAHPEAGRGITNLRYEQGMNLPVYDVSGCILSDYLLA